MKDYFYGWYLKCQSKDTTLALIPAMHECSGKRTASLQIITEDGAWNINLPGNSFKRKKCNIYLGNNRFGKYGVRVYMDTADVRIKGRLDFGPITPIKYDIMGPFAFIPFMECRHYVMSMRHTVNGRMKINGNDYVFENAVGYWEGDSGVSFPKEYLWTQVAFNGGSLMLSVADIPFGLFNFTGIIGVINYNNKEYRFATYLGAKAVEIKDKRVRIRQGAMEFEAGILEDSSRALNAPVGGSMIRTIHESAACKAYYRFRIKGKTVFSFKTGRASFEYEYSK